MLNSGNFGIKTVTHFVDRLQFEKGFTANSIILKPASLHCSLSMIWDRPSQLSVKQQRR